MSIKCYQQLLNSLKQGEDVVLATVVKVQGSVPREVGAKMLINAKGEIIDTIGGGAGEAKVIKTAQTVLATGKKQWVEINLAGSLAKPNEGICGGLMRVWLEKWSGEKAIALIEEMISLLQQGQSVRLFTPLAVGEFPYLLKDDQTQPGEDTGFEEIIESPPLLLIVGAGHVGEQLAKVAKQVGFQVAIQDDRPDWANGERYPTADHIFNIPVTDVLVKIGDRPQLYVALVTRGYQCDLDALRAIFLNKIEYNYLGMIGSQKRVKIVLQNLEKEQIFKPEVNSIYAPIGLDIGALTPEEIAISIIAEIILFRRGGTGKPLSYI